MIAPMPAFVHELIRRLRRRGLPLGIDDCADLRTALGVGYGLGSTKSFQELCVTLWATSRHDAELIKSAIHLVTPQDWSVVEPDGSEAGTARPSPSGSAEANATAATDPDGVTDEGISIGQPFFPGGRTEPPRSGQSAPYLVLQPLYPVSERDVAQAWRRLRRPIRHGPRIELDVQATILRYSASGLVTPPVLIPRRANAARLLLLVDRHGSMTPFHGFVDHVIRSIIRATRLDSITIAYFRNFPGHSQDRSALTELADPFALELDTIIDRVPPLSTGWVYEDPDLTRGRAISQVLDSLTADSAVVVVSDAGAQRGSLVATRIFDAVALGLAVSLRGARLAWLNPLDADRWTGSTAEFVSRHMPMYYLDREGMYAAVDVLRGRPSHVSAPL